MTAGPGAGLFEGTVLLLCKPLEADVAGWREGLVWFGATLDCLECLELTETLRRTPPPRRRLSAPALALEEDLKTPLFLLALLGVPGGGVPFSTSCTVCSSAAVPRMPMRKWS